MRFLEKFLRNHVLANLAFALVLVIGTLSYLSLPRQQDPTINFNWIQVFTYLPGASAADVEKRITDPIEDAIERVPNIKFVNSSSREGVSSILVRFDDISERVFDKRINDLRREIQNKEAELPEDATTPYVVEITSSNGFPTASIVVYGEDGGENLHARARKIEKDLERIKGVDNVNPAGWRKAELQVRFQPERLVALGINPTDLLATIRANFRDVSAGAYEVGQQTWLVRVLGAKSDPEYLAQMPVLTPRGEIPLGSIADVALTRQAAEQLISYQGKSAILLSVSKQANTNTLSLLERIKAYIEQRNALSQSTGIALYLVDDQTQVTRDALGVMQTNALLGLLLVLLVTWVFLGIRIAFLTSIGIPFILAGTFILLKSYGETLNVSVLLGVVISLGMLVDDAVVVVESIYYRLQRGVAAVDATLGALKEVFAPVTTAVLTTMAAFMPLMLVPGILGKFMKVIPMVVCTALAVSLIEAYWMLPAHVMRMKSNFKQPGKIQRWRTDALHRIRLRYTRWLIAVLRYPLRALAVAVLLLGIAIGSFLTGAIKVDFFASDPLRLFYINVKMPTGTTLEQTRDMVLNLERKALRGIDEGELRAAVGISGQMFTEVSAFFGDRYGQLMVSLEPHRSGMRQVDEVIAALREDIEHTEGAENIYFFRLAGGPPTTKPVDIKVTGSDFADIRAATADLLALMKRQPYLKDIEVDDNPGQRELNLTLNLDAINRVNLNPATVSGIVRLLVDGSMAATTRHLGDELEVKVLSSEERSNNIGDILNFRVTTPGGEQVPLRALVNSEPGTGMARIRHYKLRRTITIKADIDKTQVNEKEANRRIRLAWEQSLAQQHNTVELDYSGLLDDLNETISNLFFYFLIGIGLIYLILGTQFKSYFQPLLILASIPLAFAGVAMGLLITGNPLSLMGMYGVVALGGIAVNSAIVLISAANDRLAAGMSVNHAIIYAARRRVVPILITALTTIAGLFSLATGLGGASLLWGPVATAIVWGLSISTVLTLFIIPLLYRYFMQRSANKQRQRQQLERAANRT
ncbi:MAG: cation transporter [Gammaproteobacteria bacterium]|nr:MAG: cation transporter [Gammaproteobacteria bacterium]